MTPSVGDGEEVVGPHGLVTGVPKPTEVRGGDRKMNTAEPATRNGGNDSGRGKHRINQLTSISASTQTGTGQDNVVDLISIHDTVNSQQQYDSEEDGEIPEAEPANAPWRLPTDGVDGDASALGDLSNGSGITHWEGNKRKRPKKMGKRPKKKGRSQMRKAQGLGQKKKESPQMTKMRRAKLFFPNLNAQPDPWMMTSRLANQRRKEMLEHAIPPAGSARKLAKGGR
ncbi:hypothetical protein HDV00_003255 [Rhizophlyctis rosea]|nr:hypothetical protein HDV00_003255 [Rhizophlyctis rosea]